MNLFGWAHLTALDLILLLALWVITPLALPLAASPRTQHDWLYTWQQLVIILQPFVALIGGLSLLLSTGPFAAAAATVWFLFTGLIAVQGVGRLREVRQASLADICLAVALIYLPIGGVWLVIARLGLQPLGFSPDIVLLTAVHFHYIPLAALVMTGLIGQTGFVSKTTVPWKLYRVAAIGLLVEPLLVAAGRTLAQLTGNDDLVTAATLLLALSLMLIAVLSLQVHYSSYKFSTRTRIVIRIGHISLRHHASCRSLCCRRRNWSLDDHDLPNDSYTRVDKCARLKPLRIAWLAAQNRSSRER